MRGFGRVEASKRRDENFANPKRFKPVALRTVVSDFRQVVSSPSQPWCIGLEFFWRLILNSSPAFQFYPNDWLSSPKVAMMSPAQEGAYIRLLSYDWSNNGIPDDEKTLLSLSRLTDSSAIALVVSCFRKHPKKSGFLTNTRLMRERRKQAEHRKERSNSGLKGAKARWLSHSSAIQEPMAKNGSSSSSSSSVHINRLHGIPKTAEEVVEYGKSIRPIVDEAQCRHFFNHYESQARTNASGELFWVTSGNAVVTNWKAKLQAFQNNGVGSPKAQAQKTEIKLTPAQKVAIARGEMKDPNYD